MYKLIEKVDVFEDIPWDEPIIISGSIDSNQSWFWRMSGVFKKNDGDFRFMDEHGMATQFSRNDSISLNILAYARKPEEEK